MTADEIIKKLKLVPLPEEGGYYKETFRDKGLIAHNALTQHSGARCYSTAIYYLITQDEFSGLHAVASTEIFHFYCGDPVEMIQITPEGQLDSYTLGNDIAKDQHPQVVVAPQIWQGTKLIGNGNWALLGCTVAPGFEFADFYAGDRRALARKFPQHTALIQRFTHD